MKDVWERNRQFHEEMSRFFGHYYTSLVFEERMKPFSGFGENRIKITIAEEEEEKSVIGYCLSTIDNHEGQMQTLHVLEDFRGNDIGKELMRRHLEWFETKGCTEISLVVSNENEKAIRFYENHGFRKNTIEMRLFKS
ncbi:GNAT family N-acetyltransferase [Anoxynatronum buryatiense]|nr:GNAT family N-acetyltransferase [Anoxynatronum buryatiense]